jgi:putative transposase
MDKVKEGVSVMPRTARLISKEGRTAYHLISRTALDGFPFGDVEKDMLVEIIKKVSRLFFVDVFGFCIMSNHFHVLIQTVPGSLISDENVIKRLKTHYGKDFEITDEGIKHFRGKLSSLSGCMKEIKQSFSWYYNKRHNRRGTLWAERFKSVIVEKGETLVNCLAYIDLNPLRAGLVKRPEDYRWNSMGYHFQSNNKDNFLSTDLGMKEFGAKDKGKRLRRYRQYVYEAGAIDQPLKGRSKVIAQDVVEKERKKGFKITRTDRFKLRTRYFTDSGIIGSKEFVYNTYSQFKPLFQSKHEKKPNAVQGLSGVFSLKRLSET